LHSGGSTKKVRKKRFEKKFEKFEKKFENKFENKFAKKVRKYYKLSEGGRGGREGGGLSFQYMRPSTSLMAAGKKDNLNRPGSES
jgi:hypothetical protein